MRRPRKRSPLTTAACPPAASRLPIPILPCLLLFAACTADSGTPEGDTAPSADAGMSTDAAPTFQVDPSWPRELPNDWILGSITSVFVDAQDHVWITHLPETLTPEEIAAVQDPPMGECCVPAPVVIELDPEGNVVQAWGDPATQDISEFPRNSHGLFIDHNGHVWIGTFRHHRVMKFTRDGEHLMTLGRYDENGGSNDTELLGGPAGIWVDPETNEVFVADGYGNRRVVVFDGETGAYIRHWGAYGEPPRRRRPLSLRRPHDRKARPRPQFGTVHGLVGSNDGLLYVADRRGNRIQVFQRDGTYVTEKTIAPLTRASGSAFVVALSPDDEQRWLYLADGTNHKVWILRRSDLEVVGEFGRGGRRWASSSARTGWTWTRAATSTWARRPRGGGCRNSSPAECDRESDPQSDRPALAPGGLKASPANHANGCPVPEVQLGTGRDDRSRDPSAFVYEGVHNRLCSERAGRRDASVLYRT